MGICNCTLGGTRACLTCPNNFMLQDNFLPDPIKTQSLYPKRQKIIEKYDGAGKLIEKIIETIE